MKETPDQQEITGEAVKVDGVFMTLRSHGIPAEMRKNLNKFRFISIFIVNLLLFSVVGWAFVERYFKPVVVKKPDDKFDYLTIVIAVCLIVFIVSGIVAFLAALFLKHLNKGELEKYSSLGALAEEISLVKILQKNNRGPDNQKNKFIVRAAAHLKGDIDSLNDLASLISLATVAGSFVTGMLFFEGDSPGKLLGSLIVWILVIARLHYYFRLQVKRFWQIVLDQAKEFAPEPAPKSVDLPN